MRTRISTSIFIISLLGCCSVATFARTVPPVPAFGYSSDGFSSGGESYLGVDTRDVTPDRLSALNLKEEHGVEVMMVDQDAPAGKAGLKEQDVILSVNGTPVESVEQLRRVIHEIPAGRVISLGISRAGHPMTLKTQLAGRQQAYSYSYSSDPKNFKFTMPAIPAIPEIPAIPAIPSIAEMDSPMSVVVVHSSMRSGLMVENITPQLGDFLGAKNGEGVLVRSVERGSRAEKAGFHAGDVIVKVNGESVNDIGDFSHALRGRKENTATVGIIRDKKVQTLTLTLPATRESGEIFNESLEIPEIDVETRAALSKVNAEIAQLEPDLREITREAEESVKDVKPEIALALSQARDEVRVEREEIQKGMRDFKRRDSEMRHLHRQKGMADI